MSRRSRSVPISFSEAAILLGIDGDRDLWPGPTPEVRDSRTSRHSAQAQSQVWQMWLVLVSIYCVFKAIQNHELKWFENYLTTRCQSVVHGVPQGSILGPILFSMYNNPTDPTLCEWCCPHFFYADSHIGKISTILNKDLKRLQSWTHHNNLCIRHVKIQNVAFGTQQRIASRATLSDGPFLGENPKNQAQHHTYLGVLIDANLNFK